MLVATLLGVCHEGFVTRGSSRWVRHEGFVTRGSSRGVRHEGFVTSERTRGSWAGELKLMRESVRARLGSNPLTSRSVGNGRRARSTATAACMLRAPSRAAERLEPSPPSPTSGSPACNEGGNQHALA
jgi:hypothetical protein